jgi:serine/threonine protein kinase
MGKASYASDVYSIGCIFYEMIIGRPPIFDPDPFKILEKAQQGKITPPRIRNHKVPKEVDEIIMKCLAARVEDRYQGAGEITRGLSLFKGRDTKSSEIEDIFQRIKAREARKALLCWNCRRPLPLKSRSCPHCGESV